MNGNIGVKGGKQDRKRVLKIKRRQLKKLKERKKKIERTDIKTFLEIIPIILTGETFQIIFRKKEKEDKKRIENKIQITIIDKTNLQQKNKKKNKEKKIERLILQKNKTEENKKAQQKPKILELKGPENIRKKEKAKNKLIILNPTTIIKRKEKRNSKNLILVPITRISKKRKENNSEKTNNIKEEQINDTKKTTETEKINLDNLTNIKIIEEYEKRFKEIRYSLRKLIYEYQQLKKETKDIFSNQEAQILIDKLNLIIQKLEELKEKIKIENIEKYDNNYIYHLVNEYLKEFSNKKIVDTIKDSPLYILISEKLKLLDQEKDNLHKKLIERQEKVIEDEQSIELIRKKKEDFLKFDQRLSAFQEEQAILLKRIQQKVESSISEYEKVETKISAMNLQTKKLLELISLQMLIPNLRNAKNTMIATVIYMHFIRRILKADMKTTKYKLIRVNDYSYDIENIIYTIDKTATNLNTTTKKLSSMIKDLENTYKEYYNAIPEYRELLYNMRKIQSSLKEKEFELKKLKQQQEYNLQVNNEKVKKYNNRIEKL